MPPDVLPFLKYNLHWRILDVSFHFQNKSALTITRSLMASSVIRGQSILFVLLWDLKK